MGDVVHPWMEQFFTFLVVIAIFTGTPFGAVELVNSNMFGLKIFSMGLRLKNIRDFNSRRLVNNVVLEVSGGLGCSAIKDSFVHVCMYLHYFVTALGFQNPFKKWITKLSPLHRHPEIPSLRPVT